METQQICQVHCGLHKFLEYKTAHKQTHYILSCSDPTERFPVMVMLLLLINLQHSPQQSHKHLLLLPTWEKMLRETASETQKDKQTMLKHAPAHTQ